MARRLDGKGTVLPIGGVAAGLTVPRNQFDEVLEGKAPIAGEELTMAGVMLCGVMGTNMTKGEILGSRHLNVRWHPFTSHPFYQRLHQVGPARGRQSGQDEKTHS